VAQPAFNRKAPATEDDIGDLLVWATLGIHRRPARLGHLLRTSSCARVARGWLLLTANPNGLPLDFLDHPLRLISAWDGGMSFHGGLIGVVAALWLFTWRPQARLREGRRPVAAVTPIGCFSGRIANFING
jgi:phosphatidylglycerol:prolipoprotein diacylglycerol transferase